MKKENIAFSGSNGTNVDAVVWSPTNNKLNGIIIVIHGLAEYIGRYETLAKTLTENGYVTAGFDLSGHGQRNDSEIATIEENEGWIDNLVDINTLSLALTERYGNLPKYLLGFSFGSFLARDYIDKCRDCLSGMILISSRYQYPFSLDLMLCSAIKEVKKVGFHGTSDWVAKMISDKYNKYYKPNQTSVDWLCSDKKELSSYLSDAMIKKKVSAGLYLTFIEGMIETCEKLGFVCIPKELPILLLNGDDDAVDDFGKGVDNLYGKMKASGLNVEIETYQDARHDLLHEEECGAANEARNKIVDWLSKNRSICCDF